MPLKEQIENIKHELNSLCNEYILIQHEQDKKMARIDELRAIIKANQEKVEELLIG